MDDTSPLHDVLSEHGAVPFRISVIGEDDGHGYTVVLVVDHMLEPVEAGRAAGQLEIALRNAGYPVDFA